MTKSAATENSGRRNSERGNSSKKLYSVNENFYQKQEDTEMAMDYGRCAKEIFETLGALCNQAASGNSG